MYQAALEGLLGLRRTGSTFSINPNIPAMWVGYSVDWRVAGTRYRITVTNPNHQTSGIESTRLDGVAVNHQAIPIEDDGAVHEVEIVIGKSASQHTNTAGSRSLRVE